MPLSYQLLEDIERRQLEAKWDTSMLGRVGAVLPLR